jgi:hypothetical protein
MIDCRVSIRPELMHTTTSQCIGCAIVNRFASPHHRSSEWVLSYKHKNSLDLLQFYQMPRTAKFNWIRWKFPLRVECVAYDTNRISIGLSIVPDNFVSTQSKIYRGLTGIIDSSATQIHLPPCMEISNAQTKYPLPPCKKILNSHPKFLLPSYK